MGWSPFRQLGLTHHDPSRSFKGYTLLTPLGGKDVLLIDMRGRIVHRWFTEGVEAAYARLLDDGHLVLTCDGRTKGKPPASPKEFWALPVEQRLQWLGGSYDVVRKYTWEGEVVWEHTDHTLHHDAKPLPNGNILLSRWVEMDQQLANSVRGGRHPRRKRGMFCDVIFELTPEGEEVNAIDVATLFDPRKDPVSVLGDRNEWTHTNSLDTNATGDVLFSSPANSRICIVDATTRELRWKFDKTHAQHDARFLDDGNVLVFDNHAGGSGSPESRVVEINVETSEVAWEYKGNPGMSFFSPFISGAERLPNGNTLICEGSSGRVFEVTRSREVVWEWISPFVNTFGSAHQASYIFRPHRFAPDHPAVADKDLDPDRHKSFNQLYGLM
jgi:outer membrane protein assembly factor BamB